MKKLGILISNAGSGSNLQAIIDAIENKQLAAKIAVVISDAKNAYGLIRAKKHAIATHILKKDESLLTLFKKKYYVDFIVLTGWKKIIPDDFIDMFENKILNIHPGLIPHTMGGIVKNPDRTDALWNRGKFTVNAVKEFLDKKIPYAGSTVHFLSHEFDFGKVLGRTFEKIQPKDTVESLYARLKKKEHALLVKSLIQLSK